MDSFRNAIVICQKANRTEGKQGIITMASGAIFYYISTLKLQTSNAKFLNK